MPLAQSGTSISAGAAGARRRGSEAAMLDLPAASVQAEVHQMRARKANRGLPPGDGHYAVRLRCVPPMPGRRAKESFQTMFFGF